MTPEQQKRINEFKRSQNIDPVAERGWSTEKIKQALNDEGMTLTGLETEIGLPSGTLYQSMRKRSPKGDKAIAAFLGIHESVIWPNRYFVNGVSISSVYNIEERSDEELAKLNAEFSKPAMITVVKNWHDEEHEQFTPPVNDVKIPELPKDDDGRLIVPVGDGTVYEDVSPLVSLPPGVELPEWTQEMLDGAAKTSELIREHARLPSKLV